MFVGLSGCSQDGTQRGENCSRSCGRVRTLVCVPLKEGSMCNNRAWFLNSRIRYRHNTLSQCWLLRCVVLLLFAAVGCIPAAAQCYVYVPTHKSNSVAVIDTSVDQVIAVIPVQVQPLAVAITPNGAFAYVTNSGWIFGSNSVSVIDTASNAVVATIPVGGFPVAVAITPNGAFAYVTNESSNDVSVINTATHSVVTTVPVSNGAYNSGPYAVAIKPQQGLAANPCRYRTPTQ